MNSFDIVKTVRLTEKGTRQGEKFNQYTIVADRRATKPVDVAISLFLSNSGESICRAFSI